MRRKAGGNDCAGQGANQGGKSGSGTTGHALIDLNKEDGGNRKYILISNSESNICKDVTLKRIKMFDSNVKFIN